MVNTLKYTVAVISPILQELVAAQRHLDERHENFAPSGGDDNVYTLGTIAGHNVVIAALPDGAYGNSSAALAIKDLLRTFRNIKIGLIVGIAGGVPSKVKLGDVVVSVVRDGKGGVVQYDHGKAMNGIFKLTRPLNAPPRSLLAVVTAIRADLVADDHTIVDDLQRILDANKKMKDYHPPAKCDVNIHYGLIASGNTLMADAKRRDELAAEHNILCFEMEAAGVMNELPFLVIRGICDYADENKSDEWQGYAALTAAAYAKMVLQRLSPHTVDEGPVLQAVIHSIEKVSRQVEQQDQRMHRQKILDWLKAPDASTNYNRALELRHEGTGRWILEDERFEEFNLDIQQRNLWIHGTSGYGKTILSATIIEALPKAMYFYFDTQDIEKRSFQGMLRALIWQAGHNEYVEHLYKTHEGKTPSIAQLRGCLTQILESNPVVIVLDALDECRGVELEQLCEWINSTPRVIVVSRSEQDIRVAMKECLQLDLQSVSTNQDISNYIQYHLDHGRLKRWQNEPQVQLNIKNILLKKGNGLFRYVACQMDILKKCISRRNVDETLAKLPIGLNETYDRILLDLSPELQRHAIRLLQFLLWSDQPLELVEAVHALSVDLGADSASEQYDTIPQPQDVLLICGSLTAVVVFTRGSSDHQAVQLAHSSVREYLDNGCSHILFNPHFRPQAVAMSVSKVCISYITAVCTTHTCITSVKEEEIEAFLHQKAAARPFFHFASKAWYRAAQSTNDNVDPEMIMRFLSNTSSMAECLDALEWSGHSGMAGLHAVDKLWPDTSCCGEHPSPPWWAAAYGLQSCVEWLLSKGLDADEGLSSKYGPLLSAAARYGHLDVMSFLLRRGADVNGTDEEGRTALYHAALSGHTEIAKLLLSQGADVNAVTLSGYTPLSAAMENEIGDGKMTASLLAASAVVDIKSMSTEYGDGRSILAVAATNYNWRHVIQNLIHHGATVDMRSGPANMTAFLYAAAGGCLGSMDLLLSHGADLHAKDDLGRCALHLAAISGDIECITKLIRAADGRKHAAMAGPYVDRTDAAGWSALHWALYFGQAEAVRTLLKHDAADQSSSRKYVAIMAGYELGRRTQDIWDEERVYGSEVPYGYCSICEHELFAIAFTTYETALQESQTCDCNRCILILENVKPRPKMVIEFTPPEWLPRPEQPCRCDRSRLPRQGCFQCEDRRAVAHGVVFDLDNFFRRTADDKSSVYGLLLLWRMLSMLGPTPNNISEER